MAKAKKSPLDITKLTGLKWEKECEEPEIDVVATCSFCKTDIYLGKIYYTATHPDPSLDPTCGEPLFHACQSCATKAGLEW